MSRHLTIEEKSLLWMEAVGGKEPHAVHGIETETGAFILSGKMITKLEWKMVLNKIPGHFR